MGANPGRQRREQRLGQLMVEFGLLTEDQLATALAAQQRDRRPLGELLVALGFASSGAVHDALTEQHGWSGGSEFGFGGRLKPRIHLVPDEQPAAEPVRLEPDGAAALDDDGDDAAGAADVAALLAELQVRSGELEELHDLVAAQAADLTRLEHERATLERDLASASWLDEDALTEVETLRRRLEASEAECARLRDEVAAARSSTPTAAGEASAAHRLFVPAGGGYRLVERPGPPPEVGTIVEIEDDGDVARFVVTKLARPPLAGASEPFAYLQRI